MRVIVFFDLPVITSKNKSDYRSFRKFLIKSGFVMLQESVYCKLVQNSTSADTVVEMIRSNSPNVGLVQTLKITEKQYSKMDYIIGERKTEILDSDERLVFL